MINDLAQLDSAPEVGEIERLHLSVNLMRVQLERQKCEIEDLRKVTQELRVLISLPRASTEKKRPWWKK